jgi:predicted outer membrane lipoprotein
MNFYQTFSPVAKLATLRLLVAFAVINGMILEHIDVNTAYINADLDEEIWMYPPPGMDIPSDHVLLLKKSIYGLKQAGLNWNICITTFLLSIGFRQCVSDTCCFIKGSDINSYIFILIYVDDILIGSRNPEMIKSRKEAIANKFEIEDLGILKYYLGINFTWSTDCITMCQKVYIEKLAEKYHVSAETSTTTPLPITFKYDPGECEMMNDKARRYVEKFPVREIIGAISYIALCTRPDVSFAISYLARFQDKPTLSLCKAIKHLLKYLNSTKSYSLKFSGKINSLVGFSDADWAGDPLNRRSTTGFIFYLGNCPISWQSRLQPTVALSTVEAEYMALTSSTQEAIWLRSILKEWGLKMLMPTTIWSDNNGAILLAYNPIHHKRTKHIETKFHFIREKVKSYEIIIDHMPTSKLIADLLTKNFTARVQQNLIDQLLGKGQNIHPTSKRERIYKKLLERICNESNEN